MLFISLSLRFITWIQDLALSNCAINIPGFLLPLQVSPKAS